MGVACSIIQDHLTSSGPHPHTLIDAGHARYWCVAHINISDIEISLPLESDHTNRGLGYVISWIVALRTKPHLLLKITVDVMGGVERVGGGVCV